MSRGKKPIHVVGVGGTLRERSTSAWALGHALRASEAAGATTEQLLLHDLRLPMFEPGKDVAEFGPAVARFLAAARRADAMLWSTAGYHGTLAGATKNALDYFEFLSEDERPYLNGRIIGMIATASGELASVNSIAPMVHTAHALRGTVAPLLVAIPRARMAFDADGNVTEPKWIDRLNQLGRLVVELAQRFQPLEQEVGSR